MGLFFEKSEQESSKLFKVIDVVMLVILTILFSLTILSEFDLLYVGTLFLFLGVRSLIDAIERFIAKEQKKSAVHVGFAIIFLTTASSLLFI
ncbi:hypothetical protein ACQCVP_07485 [Rossellomorea vietnamensis]|uniref:hypothetical protein n=1 Tax=Rossellomorea vietnamensis TaxID=218284 RepID=UPI003CE8A955